MNTPLIPLVVIAAEVGADADTLAAGSVTKSLTTPSECAAAVSIAAASSLPTITTLSGLSGSGPQRGGPNLPPTIPSKRFAGSSAPGAPPPVTCLHWR